MRVKTMWSVTQRSVDWWNDNCMRLSASLAFYTALSLAPLVIIVVGVAGLITERQLVAEQLDQQIGLIWACRANSSCIPSSQLRSHRVAHWRP